MPVSLHAYENVAVSAIPFDPAEGWHRVPRPLLDDWLAIFERVARAVSPDFVAPVLPEPLAFVCETVPSDGPYPSREDYYQLDWCHLSLAGLRISFERGRQEGGEPLAVETTSRPHRVSSYMEPIARTPARARFLIWHDELQSAAVRGALGLA